MKSLLLKTWKNSGVFLPSPSWFLPYLTLCLGYSPVWGNGLEQILERKNGMVQNHAISKTNYLEALDHDF
jgi:hypothetical protein